MSRQATILFKLLEIFFLKTYAMTVFFSFSGHTLLFSLCRSWVWIGMKVLGMDSTVWQQQIWIKVKSWWQILPQHQSTNLRSPKFASIPPFRPHFIKFSKFVCYEVNLTSQRSHLKVFLLIKFVSERRDFNSGRFWVS